MAVYKPAIIAASKETLSPGKVSKLFLYLLNLPLICPYELYIYMIENLCTQMSNVRSAFWPAQAPCSGPGRKREFSLRHQAQDSRKPENKSGQEQEDY